MAEGKQRDDWNHTAALSCYVISLFSGSKKPVKFQDLHPMMSKSAAPVPMEIVKDGARVQELLKQWGVAK